MTPASTIQGAARPARPAASLVVVRDGPGGIEALLLQRAERGDLNSGAWVFAGGIVDASDRGWHCHAGADDKAVSALLDVPEGGLDYQIAALRECFEEAGVLFAVDAARRPVEPDQVAALQLWRAPLNRCERTLGELCEAAGLRLAVDRFAYLSHWLTPLGRAKRFDTRFFIAEMPAGQTVAHDGGEILAHQWLRPADALEQGRALKLMTPTQATLETIGRFDDVASMMAWARSARDVPRIFPHFGTGARGLRPVTPNEYAYAEIGRLDPEGTGTARYDIQTGIAVRLSPRVIRITANNPGRMTGPGTNTYLVGDPLSNEWAVIDPGPDDSAHVQAIVDAAPGPIRWILATHTHIDHSPAAQALKEKTGALVHGRVALHRERQDATFNPECVLENGDALKLGNETTLRVIHTPGHASNHLCYLLEEEQTLFTGDHVMQGSTVVINPPDGNMNQYIASLRHLAEWSAGRIEWLAPGHGFLIDHPRRAFERIIAHRLQREQKVVTAMRALGSSSIEALLFSVYDDVDPRMHPVAVRSLLAHLEKLRDDGAARESEGRWMMLDAASSDPH